VRYAVSSVAVIAFFLAIPYGARGQTEITLLVPGPMGRQLIPKLVAGFERETGDTVKITFAQGSRESAPWGTKQLVARGEGSDVSIMFAPFREALGSGNVLRDSATSIARLLLGVTVRKGAPKPDISTPAAVKKMLLEAKSVSIVTPAEGSLGGEAMEVFEKLGITEQMKPKIRAVEGSALAEKAVANGETDLFLGPQASDKLAPGVELVGALPPEVSTPVEAVGFVSTHARNPEGAKALLRFLKSPEAETAYKAAGMQPVN
jgi:molybdate transport system substrate-binding protein